ncbi:ice-binding family protein [Pontibacter cellulosilyticus]|uniref:DUF3494 domain-containing protein n=1 Tax=Pontibacter cellulosilyticus TaxID=1720253 RepID=A0A923N8T8_9BACT|nr:ice-binding family protein [Pontibacter cellulosilyticus]MBC5993839.1 DUF3494 domain-containing protein [Pontibacter cellulosilyticus]
MNKILLLLTLFLIGSTTLSIAQSEPGLGKSSTFAVLGTGCLSNTGTTGVTGDVGLAPEGVFTDNGLLLVKGTKSLGVPLASEALQDAKTVYDFWRSTAAVPFTDAGLKANGSFPGVYRSSGDVNLDGIIVLDGNGDVNSKFIFIIDGNLTTPAPNPPAPGTGLLLQNGAQPKNIFWIVKGNVSLGNSTSFQGTIISEGNITLEPGVNLIGRAISLKSCVNLNTNNIFLPNIIIADLSVGKVAAEGEYKIGDEVTYTVTVSNAGPGTATNVIVSEVMPPELEFVRVESASAGTYDPVRQEWVINELKINETAELKITFKILAGGTIVNKVKVGANNPDPKPGNNEGEDPIIVPVVSADLSIVKTASGAPYLLGGTVTYTIVTTNNGPYAAENVVVTESLPATLELQSFTVSKGAYDPATGIYTVGTLAKDEKATLTIVAKIIGVGQIINTASVGTTTPDPNPGNNTDPEPIEVTCPVPTLAIDGGAAQCAETANVTYTVTAVQGATYNFQLTGGLTEVSRSGNSITVNIGSATGKVIATVTDMCGNVYTVEKEVIVTSTPPAPSIEGSTSVCMNSEGLTYTASGLDDGNYQWSATGDVKIVSGQDGKKVTVKVGANGGTLSVKGSNKCFTSEAATVTITTKTPPATPDAISGPSAICGNTGDLTYSVTPVDGATGYTWKLPAGWVIESGQGTATIKVKSGTSTGDITVTANNDCGSSAAAVYKPSINNTPPAPLTINGSHGSCPGTVLTYNVAGVTGATGYTWTVPAGWTIKNGQGSSTIEVEVGQNAGQVTVAGTNECGAGATAKLDVAPAPVPPAPGTIEGPNATCANTENLTYSIAVLTGGDKYEWTVPQGWTIVSGQGTLSITVKAGAAGGKVGVTATNDCGTSKASTLDVSVTTPPAAPVAIQDMSSLCDGLKYTVDAVPGATDYTWTVPAGFTIVSGQGTTTITVKMDNPSAFGQVSVKANAGTCDGPATSLPIDKEKIAGDLNFPKAFSPNGDGKNDTWVIENLMKYPKNQVVIFNRWGSEVYKKDDYQNDWNGNKLEKGTYFYKVSVTMCDGADKVFTGYVTIFR